VQAASIIQTILEYLLVLQPVADMFCVHMHVPLPATCLQDWQHPPFGGAIADGHIWGRGAMDIKGAAVALLEAATALLKDGFQPRRTLLIALGHDEEVGGRKGAAEIAALLAGRGTKLAMVWDEGR
jgi:carboxypeptidase PM20D1